LAGVDDRAVTTREAGADGFDGGTMLVLLVGVVGLELILVGVVGLELTEELLAVSTDDLLLLDIRADWIEGRERLLAGLVGIVECPFSAS
jgi:hypothetical protein